MNARFQSPSDADKAYTAPEDSPAWGTEVKTDPGSAAGTACCCPARPAVRVVLPSSPSRNHSTELLLCAHHYRVSRAALRAARAVIRELADTPPDIAAWIGLDNLSSSPARSERVPSPR